MTVLATKEKKRRSRGGCISCKHLRIKCSEDKPTCEYCYHTKRKCVYPTPKPLKKDSKKASVSKRNNLELSSSSSRSSSAWSSQLDYELIKNLDKDEYEPALHEELTRDLVLTQASSMLGISRFELRLLQFFDQECITLLSFGVNKGIEKAWRYGVPGLFLESELTRLAMFSFAAMTLTLGIDLNMVQGLDAAEDERSLAHMYNINLDDPNNIYTKTTEYFMDTIGRTKNLIALSDLDDNSQNFQDPKVAKELTVSSVLVFSYLALDPDRLIPLIDFTRESTDLVQVAKGIRHTIMRCTPIVQNSDIGGILFFKALGKIDQPDLKLCEYPVIASLRDELYSLETDELSTDIIQEDNVLEESINGLMTSIWGCEIYKFPVPLFRYLMIISDEFRELLYKKHMFAIRIIYIYSALNAVAGFYFYRDRNVWKDYMKWYKNYVASTKENSCAEMDRQLYDLVVEKNFRWEDHTRFHEFDPAIEHHKLYKSESHLDDIFLV